MKKLIFILLFISSFTQADSTYLFCKAEKSLNPDFEFEEYTAIQIFNKWEMYIGREYSGGCQNEMRHFNYLVEYPKHALRAKFRKGEPYCGVEVPYDAYGNFGTKLDYTKFYRDTESITWTNDDDLYANGGNSHKKEQSNRILNRETLILKEIKESEKLFSQCEVVKSFKLLKKKMKEASSSLLEAQLKTNEEIKKATKNSSDRNQKTEKQQL